MSVSCPDLFHTLGPVQDNKLQDISEIYKKYNRNSA